MVLILPFQKFEVMILKEINTFIRLGCIKLIKSDSKDISHDNSRRDWHGNVYDNVNVFGLGRIDLLRCCGRASSKTCYSQYIHNMLL